MNKEEFVKELKKLNIEISNNQLNQLNEYYNMLIEYNKHTNLTRITDEKDVYLKHFYDSLTTIKIIDINNQKLLDIGTGAGFPGMVLKILFPQLKVTLVDSLNKRVIFLNEVIEKLGLEKIEAIHSRAEDYVKNDRESFDIVISRAVADLRTLCELCIPFVKIDGYFISMKGICNEELDNAQKAIGTLGGVLENVIKFKLFKEELERTLIKIKKIKKTNIKYPRKFSEIKKKPL